MSKEEVALIKQVQAGKEEAFNELFRLYYGKAYAIAYRIMNCDADAHDAAQETMLEVYRSITKLKEPSYFYSWMIRIVVSKCNRLYRKSRETYLDPLKIQAVQDYEEKRTYMLPDQISDNRIDHDILIGLIYSLKPQMSQVLDMMYLHQMKLDEIAKELNIPISTVKSRVVRGRLLLKQRIHEYERLEQRKISFHARLPLSALGFAYIVETTKGYVGKMVHSIREYASGGVLQTACVMSFTMLAISGTMFAVQDSHEAQMQHAPKTDISQNNDSYNFDETADDILHDQLFRSISYQNEHITSSIDAYYTCINWALNDVEMKTKTTEEINAILPVYIALKEKNDAYYERLITRGWAASFEAIVK